MTLMSLLLILLLIIMPICVYTTPLYVYPDPPVSDPVVPTEKDNPISKNSSDLIAQSPDVKLGHHQDLNKKILIALIASSSILGVILLLLASFSIYRLRKLKCNEKSDQITDAVKVISFSPKVLNKFNSLKAGSKKGSIAAIEYRLLVTATNNFDDANVLGEGGLGVVYKAQIDDQFHAAVKRICDVGQEAVRIFENEIDLLGRIHHQNIVSLAGYCIHNEERFLVYELMENGSLESHLHGPYRRSTLSWHLRMKVALDVARGLEHLHERCNPPVIHRDLKSSNILLDSKFNAKLSDFGLAITGDISNKTNMKISGTLGYVAPEYLLDGKLTDKSDVYAFGVILLELLTGKRPVERVAQGQCQSIVTWAMPRLTDRSKLPTIVDLAIRNTMDLKHLYQVAAIAVLCVQQEPSYRPLITDVLHSLIPLVPVELGGSLRVS